MPAIFGKAQTPILNAGMRLLRKPSRRRLDEQVEAMARFVGGFAPSSQ
jgi:hypothetical protein